MCVCVCVCVCEPYSDFKNEFGIKYLNKIYKMCIY